MVPHGLTYGPPLLNIRPPTTYCTAPHCLPYGPPLLNIRPSLVNIPSPTAWHTVPPLLNNGRPPVPDIDLPTARQVAGWHLPCLEQPAPWCIDYHEQLLLDSRETDLCLTIPATQPCLTIPATQPELLRIVATSPSPPQATAPVKNLKPHETSYNDKTTQSQKRSQRACRQRCWQG